jgi:hypothetical protein
MARSPLHGCGFGRDRGRHGLIDEINRETAFGRTRQDNFRRRCSTSHAGEQFTRNRRQHALVQESIHVTRTRFTGKAKLGHRRNQGIVANQFDTVLAVQAIGHLAELQAHDGAKCSDVERLVHQRLETREQRRLEVRDELRMDGFA